MDLRALPKIELHCHLDASVRVRTVREIAGEIGLPLPQPLEGALVAPEQCRDLADYLRRIDLALQVMQRTQDLERIARELVDDFHSDGVIYGEVRFAPQLHTRGGLTIEQAVAAVDRGLAQGRERTGVRTGLILCCLRHESPEMSLRLARLAVANVEKVCALDLAGDEARFPGAPHAPAFELAREAGLHRTVHAGEAAGAESVREALECLWAERLGHGVRIEPHLALVDEICLRAIPLEICPRSNVQTRAAQSLETHPVDRFLRRGLRVTVSTDGRTVSNSTVTREFESLFERRGWGLAEFWRCQENAANAAFASPAVRKELCALLAAAKARA